jgi:ATP-dependent Lon protease
MRNLNGLQGLRLKPGGGLRNSRKGSVRLNSEIPISAMYWEKTGSNDLSPHLNCTAKMPLASDPLEPGQVWCISPGGADEHPGLFRIEINEGPGSGVKILNKPIPPAFRESMGFAEQNLYSRALQLVGDKNPRNHEFSVQLRGFDAAKTGAKTGVAALLALCTALLKKSIRGGLIVVGEINLGGSIEPVHNSVTIAEIAVEKGATALLMPVARRRRLFDLSDDMATKVDIQFFSDARDALLKSISDG